MNNKMAMNKKGWLKIVEAFVAILLIMVVALIVISSGQTGQQDVSEKIYEAEVNVMKEVFSTYTAEEIADIEKEPEIGTYINNRIPNYLQCETRVCDINDEECEPITQLAEDESLYVQIIPVIEADKKLKLFCWIR